MSACQDGGGLICYISAIYISSKQLPTGMLGSATTHPSKKATAFKTHQRRDQKQLWAEEALVTAVCYPANCHPLFSINEDKSEEIVGRNI